MGRKADKENALRGFRDSRDEFLSYLVTLYEEVNGPQELDPANFSEQEKQLHCNENVKLYNEKSDVSKARMLLINTYTQQKRQNDRYGVLPEGYNVFK